MSWVLVIIGTALSLFFFHVLTIAVHEMGHAITACLLTKEKVVVYLGSYGDQEKSKRITAGKLEVWVRMSPLKWSGGVCEFSNYTPKQYFNIVLAGPLASLLLFVVLLSSYLILRPEDVITSFFLLYFCGWSALIFLFDIAPARDVMSLDQGQLAYNDGAKLRMLRLNNKRPEYSEALDLSNAERYAEAAVLLDKIIKDGTKSIFIYRAAVNAYMRSKDYEKATLVQQLQFAKFPKLNTEDRISKALLMTKLKKYDEAIDYYKHLLQKGGNNKFNLNNLGYTLALVNRFEEAISYLDKAILIDAQFASAYANRSYANLRLGKPDKGKADRDVALSLDPDNAPGLLMNHALKSTSDSFPAML